MGLHSSAAQAAVRALREEKESQKLRYLQERENKLWRKKNQAHHPSGERDVVLKTKDILEQRISSYQPFTHEE